jgi:hypothetical protein
MIKGVHFSFILKDLNLQFEGSEMDICFALQYMKREDGGVFWGGYAIFHLITG